MSVITCDSGQTLIYTGLPLRQKRIRAKWKYILREVPKCCPENPKIKREDILCVGKLIRYLQRDYYNEICSSLSKIRTKGIFSSPALPFPESLKGSPSTLANGQKQKVEETASYNTQLNKIPTIHRHKNTRGSDFTKSIRMVKTSMRTCFQRGVSEKLAKQFYLFQEKREKRYARLKLTEEFTH
ncbi:uncharacterized [Tachysurus ichikawai]